MSRKVNLNRYKTKSRITREDARPLVREKRRLDALQHRIAHRISVIERILLRCDFGAYF